MLRKLQVIFWAMVLTAVGLALPGPAPAGEWQYRDMVTVATVNFSPVDGDKAATLDKIKAFTVRAAGMGANIIVFPEIALTGVFPPDALAKLAEPIPGPSTLALAELTAKLKVYVVFGLVEKAGETFYNSVAVVGPEGVMGAHRKVHPIEFLEPWAAKGKTFQLFETPYGPFGIGICYSTYCFPEVARSYAVRGARLFLNPTAFPNFPDCEDYRDFYRTMLKARAAENSMFVASANIVGKSGGVPFFGYSSIIGPKPGHMNAVIFAGPAGETAEEIVLASLNLTSPDHLPQAVNTILRDRNPEVYGHLTASK